MLSARYWKDLSICVERLVGHETDMPLAAVSPLAGEMSGNRTEGGEPVATSSEMPNDIDRLIPPSVSYRRHLPRKEGEGRKWQSLRVDRNACLTGQ